MANPVNFVKAHPVATITLLAVGYMVVPWTLGKVSATTGINVNLPQPGGG
jgi:hypothetical protein